MWDDLLERFSQGNAPRIHELKTDITLLRQEGQTVGIITKILKEKDTEKVRQFLMGLDLTAFGTLRTQILSLEPLLSLNKAYALVIQEDRQQHISRGCEQKVEISAFYAIGRTQNK
ncbi:hypothetical protein H6P81_018978 [Aristolochia fimbriata]|uniref:Uncharacterized protein n=1 Tax=Aristolochia fimbriata TaxID=158543 RepID=A0AAV7E4L8_ARIFI|nr:hypothetical protein H6P81_018978 [Aristolochia fimbriata]